MAAEFPILPYTANQQNEGSDTPGDLTIANAKDYNIHDDEIKAVTDNLRAGLIRAFRNNTGGTLTSGTLVHITGFDATSGLPTVIKSQANVFGTLTEYVVIADVLNNANGNISNRYIVATLNTSSFSAGDEVYLDPSTPGIFTITAPVDPNFAQYIGKVTKVDATIGEIEFNIGRPTVPDGTTLGYKANEVLEIRDSGVTSIKIAGNAVITSKINPSAVTDTKLAAGAVTPLRLSDVVADRILRLDTITHDNEGDTQPDTFRFTIQVQDVQQNNVAQRCKLFIYISDTDFGDPFTITTLTAGTGTDITITPAQSIMVITDATGKILIDAEWTGTGERFLIVALDQEVQSSSATWA